MSKRKKKGNKLWSASYGQYGYTVRVGEQASGGRLYLFWIDNTGVKRKRSLGHRDRDGACAAAREFARRLAAGEGVGETAPLPPSALTLREGVERALDPHRGMYPTETRHVKETRRLMERALQLLGPELTWVELKPSRMQQLVRERARSSKEGRGYRTTVYMCDMIYNIARWLRDEELIPEGAGSPKRNWKTRMHQEWEAITGKQVRVRRLRHSEEEVRRIFSALRMGDPRVWLLVELAAELRSGQAMRARRSDLDLTSVGGYELGRFEVRGSGKKHGEVIDLHPELRAVVDEVLEYGYLQDAETAYRLGEIEDYYLFPAGRFRDRKAIVERATEKHLDPTAIRGMFLEVEGLAGVEHVQGRLFYGLRRFATDAAADLHSDDRVLDRLSGHRDSSTRKRVYQDRESEKVRAAAAQVRRQMRHRYRGREAGEGIPEVS